jgi:hypothetical protein
LEEKEDGRRSKKVKTHPPRQRPLIGRLLRHEESSSSLLVGFALWRHTLWLWMRDMCVAYLFGIGNEVLTEKIGFLTIGGTPDVY